MIFLRKHRSYHNSTSLVDLLFNTLIGFFLMFVMAFILITVEKNTADIKTKAEFIITVTWEGDNDVDTWIENPLGERLYFRKKYITMAHLDRDDLGSSKDTFVMASGEKIEYKYNQEITTIRGNIPGEWIFNVHLYKVNTSPEKTKVSVTIQKLNPTSATVYQQDVMLNKYWQEKTIIRLKIDAKGYVVGRDNLFKKLIRDSKGRGNIDKHELDDENTRRGAQFTPDSVLSQSTDHHNVAMP